ncbi:hypothetical protein GDO81_009670 [Engystomops pustulosus]|uniref:Uncharacterized protein n=1 Tax=Engystomops pustulosus TaxID=76066 RepID=A0AAV7BSS5_ENGPU|nr:hypothetical protein GDO81_009670 [Engystomops pustulosus]
MNGRIQNAPIKIKLIFFHLYNVANVRCLTPSLVCGLHCTAVNLLQAPRTVVEVKAAIQYIESLVGSSGVSITGKEVGCK